VATLARGSGKQGDLREVTTAVLRFRAENPDVLPIAEATAPTVALVDANGDGVIKVLLDSAAPDATQGSLPPDIDVECVAPSGSFADAVDVCFGSIDLSQLVPFFLEDLPRHFDEDVTETGGRVPSYDKNLGTADFSAKRVNRRGEDLRIYVKDKGGNGGTPFPSGALKVWSMDKDGEVLVLKNDAMYGKK